MKFLKKVLEYINSMVAWSRDIATAFNPESKGNITNNSIGSVLRGVGISSNKYQITDGKYSLISRSDMEKFIEYSFAKTQKYISETFDCDNFSAVLYGQMSYVLAGFAVGIIHVKTPDGGHALNFFIDKNRRFYYIEPQTNQIFTELQGKNKGYVPYFALI